MLETRKCSNKDCSYAYKDKVTNLRAPFVYTFQDDRIISKSILDNFFNTSLLVDRENSECLCNGKSKSKSKKLHLTTVDSVMSEIPEYLFLDLSLLYGSGDDDSFEIKYDYADKLNIYSVYLREIDGVKYTNSFSKVLSSTKTSIILHYYLIHPNSIIKCILIRSIIMTWIV